MYLGTLITTSPRVRSAVLRGDCDIIVDCIFIASAFYFLRSVRQKLQQSKPQWSGLNCISSLCLFIKLWEPCALFSHCLWKKWFINELNWTAVIRFCTLDFESLQCCCERLLIVTTSPRSRIYLKHIAELMLNVAKIRPHGPKRWDMSSLLL